MGVIERALIIAIVLAAAVYMQVIMLFGDTILGRIAAGIFAFLTFMFVFFSGVFSDFKQRYEEIQGRLDELARQQGRRKETKKQEDGIF